MKFHNHFIFKFLSVTIFASCSEEAPPFAFMKPANFPNPTYTFENNPVTERGFNLGKQLFFDPLLSRDGTVSCTNCHQQATAFADGPQHPLRD